LVYLLYIIVHLIIRHFRKEVFRSLKKEIRPKFYKAALSGDVMLCEHSLQRVFIPTHPKLREEPGLARLYIVASNRSKVCTVKEIVDFLWDFNDRHLQKH